MIQIFSLKLGISFAIPCKEQLACCSLRFESLGAVIKIQVEFFFSSTVLFSGASFCCVHGSLALILS